MRFFNQSQSVAMQKPKQLRNYDTQLKTALTYLLSMHALDQIFKRLWMKFEDVTTEKTGSVNLHFRVVLLCCFVFCKRKCDCFFQV